MKKNIYITLLILTVFLFKHEVFAATNEKQYKKENISHYFSGVISSKQNYYDEAFEHLKQIQSLKSIHSSYNIEFIRTLVLVEKFKKAFDFSSSVWKEDEFFFEADLLLGLNFFIKKNYKSAEKHFERLNKISRYNIYFDNFIGNILLAWSQAAQGKKDNSFKFLKKIPKPFYNIQKAQDSLLQCYFDTKKTENSFVELVENKDYNFSRYNYFFANYLLTKNKNDEAKKIIKISREKYNANLLLKQTENFLENNKNKKVTSFFNCQNVEDSIAEFFYIIANLYASDNNFQLSNFYLKISLYLNSKFLPNKTLLAENFFYQNQKKKSKKVYSSVRSIGPVYSWYASKNISRILLTEKGKKYSVINLEKSFKSIKKPNYEIYYELANFYKNNDYHEESIKYYSLALNNIKKDHILVPKILERRGTSYERIDNWEKAEKDLQESLRILPDQAYVLNYLAYTWIEKGINLDKSLIMLEKANKLKKDDAYITDSVGWVYYIKKDYVKAAKLLQKAVELLPLDPTINDHYADALWMLDKKIQARYFWDYVLKLDNTDKKVKEIISKKLIFGVN